MAYDEEEKSTSGELEDTVKGIADHSRLERSDTGDQPKEDKPKSNDDSDHSSKNGNSSDHSSNSGQKKRSQNKNDSKKSSENKSGSKTNGASTTAKQGGVQEGTKEAAKQGAEEAAKTSAKAAAAAATGGAGAVAGAAMDYARKKFAKGAIVFFLCFNAFICTFMFMLPSLLLQALLYDTARFVINGYYTIRSEWFGYDDFCDLPKEEQEKIVEEATHEFFGDVGRAASGFTKTVYTIFSKLDEWTDDSTLIGGWIDDASNFFFGTTVSIDQAVLAYDDPNYDAQSYMPLLVMQRLRYYFTDPTSFVDLKQLQNEESNAYDELVSKYSTNYDSSKKGTSEDAKIMLQFFTLFDGTANPPACNVPIKIEGKENWVTMDGELLGTCDEETGIQILDDCIIYNPYGNTRSCMNMSMGSNYELYTHASYVIAMYSACTPYEDQSLADLMVDLNDGLDHYFGEEKQGVVYSYKLTEVYHGALAPRFYQPVLYRKDNDWQIGDFERGYFASSTSDNAGKLGPENKEILGMKERPELLDEGYQQVTAYGWFDADGSGLKEFGETHPIVLQTLGTPGAGKVLPSSYCVVSSDPRRCNINYDYNMQSMSINDILNSDGKGFYIYGTENGKQPYAVDWQDEFTKQLNAQQRFYDSGKMTPEAQKNFVFRFQMPFTRTSYNDDYYHVQFVPLTGSDYDGLATMAYCDNEDSETSRMVFNGGKIHGYYAWCYLPESDQEKFVLKDPDQYRDDPISAYRDLSPDNWSYYTQLDDIYEMKKEDGYETKNYIYHSKIRYFISADITAKTNFLDAVAKCFNYDAAAPTPGYATIETAEGEQIKRKIAETQGEYAMSVYQNYLDMMGVDPEEIVAANPMLGSERQYSYTEMLSIVRNLTNADGTPCSMNQKYLGYLSIACAGHMLYDYGNDLEPGINYTLWIQDAPPDPKSKFADRIGTDCSGFVSWVYRTAFKDQVLSSRFNTTALSVSGGEHTGTKEVREGKASASCYLGEVFTDQKSLKVGDVSIYIKWEQHVDTGGSSNTGRVTWERKAHAMLYLGIDKDEPTKHIWIEMTRYNSEAALNGQVNGVRIMSYENYGAKRDAVFIRLSKKIPSEDVVWTEVSPSWMMIPKKGEV